jgi:hypothetical protein
MQPGDHGRTSWRCSFCSFTNGSAAHSPTAASTAAPTAHHHRPSKLEAAYHHADKAIPKHRRSARCVTSLSDLSEQKRATCKADVVSARVGNSPAGRFLTPQRTRYRRYVDAHAVIGSGLTNLTEALQISVNRPNGLAGHHPSEFETTQRPRGSALRLSPQQKGAMRS